MKFDQHRSCWLDYRQQVKLLAERMWRTDPKEIVGISPPITRQEWYEIQLLEFIDRIFEDERLWKKDT